MLTVQSNSTCENKSLLLVEIISAHICEPDDATKYVLYTIQVRHTINSQPATIERRYNHFLKLYNDLQGAQFGDALTGIDFPRKALIGNFDNRTIATRTKAFEIFLHHIIADDKLRSSKQFIDFLQTYELIKAKTFIAAKQFIDAVPLLQNNFILLNNIYTDRSSFVLLALCRLLGCTCAINTLPNVEKWADLALHRFDAVSDSDLLILYIPLLFTCIKVWKHAGRDVQPLEDRLNDMKRRGINCDNNLSLLDAVIKVEMMLSDL